jgi:hypothetical protein
MPIRLGLTSAEKAAEVVRYCSTHPIKRVVHFSHEKFKSSYALPDDVVYENVPYDKITFFIYYYRLLQEVDKDTLLVMDECLRNQNRYNLTHNCLRSYLRQTDHKLIFQYLPCIDSIDDFMTLFDWDTESKWKWEKPSKTLFSESDIQVRPVPVTLAALQVETDAKTKDAYAKEKRKLIDTIGLSDPHIIPRGLHLLSGKAKLPYVGAGAYYVARNDRFKVPTVATYRDTSFPGHDYTVLDFCHNFLDFADFLTLSRQHHVDALVSDLKVDGWYFDRYQAWLGRIRESYSNLR